MKLKELLRVNEVDSAGINSEYLETEVRYLDRFSHGEIQRYLESPQFKEDLKSESKMFRHINEKGGLNLHFHFTCPEHYRMSIRADGSSV